MFYRSQQLSSWIIETSTAAAAAAAATWTASDRNYNVKAMTNNARRPGVHSSTIASSRGAGFLIWFLGVSENAYKPYMRDRISHATKSVRGYVGLQCSFWSTQVFFSAISPSYVVSRAIAVPEASWLAAVRFLLQATFCITCKHNLRLPRF